MAAHFTPSAKNDGVTYSINQWQQWLAFGVYIVLAVSLLFADVARAVGGFKPGELLLFALTGVVFFRRLVQRDGSYVVTLVDGAFLCLILTGTLIPLLTLEFRGTYISTDIVKSLLGPVQYYVWYRVFLEALPLPARLSRITQVALVTVTLISAIGILQYIHFPHVQELLLKYFPSFNVSLSTQNHRATSVVGGWEVLGSLAAYAIIYAGQTIYDGFNQPKRTVSQQRWHYAYIGMTVINLGGLVATKSIAGFIALAVGIIGLVVVNRKITRLTVLILVGALLASLAVLPVALGRLKVGSTIELPKTWADRFLHWQILAAVLFVDVGIFIFGFRPAFTYPVLIFNSTESMYLLLLYRGGIIYLLGFLIFLGLIFTYIVRARIDATGETRSLLNIALVLFATNAIIDILDAHLFAAGESQFLFTALAVAVGMTLRSQSVFGVQAQPITGDTATAIRPRIHPLDIMLQPRIRIALSVLLIGSISIAGLAWNRNRHLPPAPTTIVVNPFAQNSPVATDNQSFGTFRWQIDAGADTTAIQGYAALASALPGDNVPLYISSTAATTYNLDVYRIGWYWGWGGKEYFSQQNLASKPQGNWSASTGLVNCSSCQIDSTTHRIDAQWQQSYTLPVGASWPSGVYLIKLTAQVNGQLAESYIPLVVRDESRTSTFLMTIPVTSWQAGNLWGGYSLYAHNDAEQTVDQPDRATSVSFNRPYSRSAGAGELLNNDIHTIRWFERMNLDVSYTTSIDINAQPSTLLTHHVLVDTGHDAYWTKAQRDGYDKARETSVNMFFFGAQTAYWQARLTPDSQNNLSRTLTCYKVTSDAVAAADQLRNDPVYATAQKALTTAPWRDPVLSRPENGLLGIMFTGYSSANPKTTWTTPQQLQYVETVNTQMTPNEVFTGINGPAFDGIILPTNNVGVLGTAKVTDTQGNQQTAFTTITSFKQDTVFVAGSDWFSRSIDDFSAPAADEVNTVGAQQKISYMMVTIIRTFCLCGGA